MFELQLSQQLLVQLRQLFFLCFFLSRYINIFTVIITKNENTIIVEILLLMNVIILFTPNYFLFGFTIKNKIKVTKIKEIIVQKLKGK